MLYELLRESDGFTYDVNSEMKRRVNTRQGESAAVKLARDIHILLSIVEGADMSCLRDMISISKRPTRSSSVTRPIARTTQMPDRCACQAELKQMKDNICCLQADILLVKQRQAATENIRCTEIKQLRVSLDDLNTKISDVEKTIGDSLNTVKMSVSEVKSSLTAVKSSCVSELSNITSSVETMSETVSELKLTILTLQDAHMVIQNSVMNSIGQIESRDIEPGGIGHTTQKPSNIQVNTPTLLPEGPMPSESNHVTLLDMQSHPLQQSMANTNVDSFTARIVSPPPSPAIVDIIPHPLGDTAHTNHENVVVVPQIPTSTIDGENDSYFGNTKIPTIITDRDRRHTKDRNNTRRKTGQQKQINFGIIHREMADAKERRQRTFNMYQQNRIGYNADAAAVDADDDDADFSQYVRHRTKRFYVGGFRPSITESKLTRYITKRGPKVTKVSISQNRRYGNVIIQVNIEDDENAHLISEDPYFWPNGVTCRPWVPYAAYKSQYRGNNSDENSGYNRDTRYPVETSCENGYYDNNRFSAIDTDID
ncbi:MAG: hypothetical protein ABW185_03860 [Sedimenticola sp.]